MTETPEEPQAREQEPLPHRPYHDLLWHWQYTENAEGQRLNVALPERYTVTFRADGTASFLVDCNRGVSAYETDDDKLTLKPIALTRMMCFGASQEKDYLAGLNKVSAIAWSKDELKLRLSDGGVMVFAPVKKP